MAYVVLAVGIAVLSHDGTATHTLDAAAFRALVDGVWMRRSGG